MASSMISVTTVLKDAYERHAFRIPPDVLVAAGERGSLVHRIIPSLIDPDRFYVPLADKTAPAAQGYIKSFMAWHELMVDDDLHLEKEIVCDCYQFIGHIDWIGRLIDGSIGILDWKTPITEGKVWAAQIAAYHHLVTKHLIYHTPKVRIGAIMLNPKGKMGRMIEYTDKVPQHFNDFLTALAYRRVFA